MNGRRGKDRQTRFGKLDEIVIYLLSLLSSSCIISLQPVKSDCKVGSVNHEALRRGGKKPEEIVAIELKKVFVDCESLSVFVELLARTVSSNHEQ